MITENSLNIVKKITEKIPSFHHHYHILYDIANNIKKDTINYVEIGAYAGASAILMLHNKNVKVISIDIGKPIGKQKVLNNINIFFSEERFKYIQGNSQNQKTIDELLKITNEIDILFIDGDHSFEGVIKDFENYSNFVSKNGFIVFDDYRCPICVQVKPAVDKIVKDLDKNKFEVIGAMENIYGAHPKKNKGNCFIVKKI